MTGNKSKVTYAFALSILAVIAMVSASYAWLGISRIPSVTDMSLSVITDNALLIAPDQEGTPGQWDNYLDLSAVFENMEPLKPVTYSSAEDSFYGVEYGTDGRPSGTSPDTAGQMITYEFWMKSSGSTAAIRLASPTLTPDGKKGAGTYVVGEPVWNGETISHDNGGHGAETTIRMGFRCIPTDSSGEENGESRFYIYEPNADIHVDGSEGYRDTPSVDGSPSLVDEEYLIVQGASTWEEQEPVLKDVVIYDLGDFQTNPVLFNLSGQSMVKIIMYIWMEGQDVDCTNMAVSKETRIAANIQFGVDMEERDDHGVTIEPR